MMSKLLRILLVAVVAISLSGVIAVNAAADDVVIQAATVELLRDPNPPNYIFNHGVAADRTEDFGWNVTWDTTPDTLEFYIDDPDGV